MLVALAFQTIVQLLLLVKNLEIIENLKFICFYIDLEIEPRQLEPVEFIVSGSVTGGNNTLAQYSSGNNRSEQYSSGSNRLEQYSNGNNRLEQYSNGNISNLTTSNRTMTSTENTAYNERINS